jgi:hypothetical protein
MALRNLIDKRFSRLVVIGRALNGIHGEARWICRCECGREVNVASQSLVRGATKSCGCLSKEMDGRRNWRHGMTKTKERDAWNAMKQRCLNPSNPQYRNYGGRGITVCSRWLESFLNFLEDVGTAPSRGKSWSIERIDNEGNYEPGNCRWATVRDQSRNKRTNVWVYLHGERMLLTHAIDKLGIPRSTVLMRIHRGWSIDRALSP